MSPHPHPHFNPVYICKVFYIFVKLINNKKRININHSSDTGIVSSYLRASVQTHIHTPTIHHAQILHTHILHTHTHSHSTEKRQQTSHHLLVSSFQLVQRQRHAHTHTTTYNPLCTYTHTHTALTNNNTKNHTALPFRPFNSYQGRDT